MDKKAKKQGKYNSIGVFSTLALSDENEIEPDTKIPIPSTQQVERARNWVNENEK